MKMSTLMKMPSSVVKIGNVYLELDKDSGHDLEFLDQHGLSSSYEPDVSNLVRRIVVGAKVFVDVGANNGYYSAMVGKMFGDSGRVYAFEPDPNSYSRLLRNVKLNGLSNIITFNLALSDVRGLSHLWLSPFDDGQNSFVRTPGSRLSNSAVRVERLDDVLPKMMVDVIKIDVEGFEAEVIKGAEKIIQRSPGIKIILEYNARLLAMRHVELNFPIRLVKSLGLETFLIGRSGTLSRVERVETIPDFCNLLVVRRS